MIKKCPRCSNAVEMKTLGAVSAEDAPLELTTSAMPAAVCAKGHAAPVDREFMLWLIPQEVHLRLRQGAPSKSERRQAFPFDLAYQGAPAFKAEIEMPMYKCTGCGKEQLRSTKAVQGHTAQAIAALNDAAGFPHSG